jgi:uncharacterized protein YidB (DUF937 family)
VTRFHCGFPLDGISNHEREGHTMSGLLGQLLGGLFGGGQQGSQPTAIAGVLQQILAGGGQGTNGVAALVSRFEAAGLGQQAQSWVSTTGNLPISADELTKVFSQDEIQGWAQQAGTSPDAILKVLSEALPKAVDHVTPQGQMPMQTADLTGMLAKFLGSQGPARTS